MASKERQDASNSQFQRRFKAMEDTLQKMVKLIVVLKTTQNDD